MMKVLHLSDIHLGSGLSHGRVNPETGLNTRLEDFISSLSECIDRAIAEPVDLVLFGGDAFPDATPPPYVSQGFARQFYRLVEANIPTVLLVGNHDQHAQGKGGASLSIYQTLGVPGFIVGDRLALHNITTPHGPVQVITLPWLTRSSLFTRPETKELSLSEINHQLIDRLRTALEAQIRRLNPDLPTILLAHVMVDNAHYGAERFLAVGKGFTIPLSILARPCFDYVALGHVHKHQILCDRPPVVYPGSIERVDFSEEKEQKGYVLVEVEKGQANVEFCPLSVRGFKTIKVDITQAENPQEKLIQTLEKSSIQDAVVRLIYQIRSEQLDSIDSQQLYERLEVAHSYTIQPELVSQLSRTRLPELGQGKEVDPLSALQAYLDNREDLQELAPQMLEAAQELLSSGNILES
ncbi:exonuclease subunit SbcD [Roseofilum sp. BLCC_M91]|uniref:Nuclease SbcCD subunit D n=1 Tax=Roseofilum halophilum BLCC-M91 TaxID=3022259 RepID=A0ABT7BM05_9CYAN|nr:exonuclease subunit SbcD [Roseofilum halophilum BLCC-M91]